MSNQSFNPADGETLTLFRFESIKALAALVGAAS
jgi:hypothetical protein